MSDYECDDNIDFNEDFIDEFNEDVAIGADDDNTKDDSELNIPDKITPAKKVSIDSDDEAEETDEEHEKDLDDFELADDELEEEPDAPSVPSYTSEIIVVKPEKRRTSHVLSKFEMTEIVSIRNAQIAQTGQAMVEIGDLDDPVKIAKKELMMRRCPLILRREVGRIYNAENNTLTTKIETWNPSEMQFAVQYNDVL
jgi:DNA-directed RNA polymerase subunit K/omega